jgi:hypothetical protein
MADIIAQQIVNGTIQQIPQGMALNSFFDSPAPILGVLGIPWWVPITALAFLIEIGWPNIHWFMKLAWMRPVKGYRDTLKQATKEDVQTWVLEKTMKLTIEMLRYVDGVLSYYSKLRIQKWLHTTRQSVMHCGGLPALLVSDDYDRSRDIVSEIALCEAADTYNHWLKPVEEVFSAIENGNIADLAKYVDRGKLEEIREALAKVGGCDIKEIKPITSYSEYEKCGQKFLRILWPKGIPVPSYSIYNPTKFSRYFPRGRSAGLRGRVLIRESRELQEDLPKPDWKEKLIQMGAIVVISLFLLVVAWMAPLGMPHA